MKKVLIGIGVVVLIFGVLIWQVTATLDSIVAGMIEDTGSEVLQTKVSVSGVSISLKEAKAGIAGMTIANPDGYSSANLFTLEAIEVELDLKSLGKEVLVIKSIRIHNPQIVYEGDSAGGSNMQTLLNNIEAAPAGASGDAGGESMRMIIDRFEFTGGQVKGTSALKPGETMEFKLPAVKMTGIGRPQGGVTADVVAQQVAGELVNSVIEAALKAGVNKALEKKKSDFQKKLGELLKGKG